MATTLGSGQLLVYTVYTVTVIISGNLCTSRCQGESLNISDCGNSTSCQSECMEAFTRSVVNVTSVSIAQPCADALCLGVQLWHQNDGQLWSLRLPNAGLAGNPFPPGLSKCNSSLQDLELPSNFFSGPLPSDLCRRLPYLTELDLSHNQFSGPIPSSLKACLYLNSLSLQGNRFSGPIPSELASLPRLRLLNLSGNSLSGPIPSSFYSISSSSSSSSPSSSLESLASKFPASAFTGNPGLCGPPLPIMCTDYGQFPHSSILIIVIAFLLLICLLVLGFILDIHHRLVIGSKDASATASFPVELMFDSHLRLSWKSLQQATSGFSHANILGVGGSATVYKGQLPNDQMIAIKVLQKEDNTLLYSTDLQNQFLTELDVLGKLRHRNLVRILGYCFNMNNTMAIILDFMPMGSLEAFLHNNRALPEMQCSKTDWDARFQILRGIAEGLAYLHHEYDGTRCVIHGDLKPGNVLLDAEMEAHIADFGLARMVRATNTTSVPTPSRQRVLANGHWWSFGYTAPECAQQGVVSRKSDVFSFGVTMLKVLTGERPSSAKLEEGQTLADWVGEALARGSGAIDAVVASELKKGNYINYWKEEIGATLKLACTCTSYQPSARPDMHQVLALLQNLAPSESRQNPHLQIPSLLYNEDESRLLTSNSHQAI
ncbi:hypothetical protein GOP47_0014484 [Adiantum capillus-veneris]|uniref:non-specific serine/threonine protein kinase n=1 Tax=Adiantum capillus-veneris TaxID=13818 RepID=A0A9D4UMC1_ADICA|nr:hypothetical protein GOP47_0014484 [Adiantum capillus-veneris]